MPQLGLSQFNLPLRLASTCHFKHSRKTGTLHLWSRTICEAYPPMSCPYFPHHLWVCSWPCNLFPSIPIFSRLLAAPSPSLFIMHPVGSTSNPVLHLLSLWLLYSYTIPVINSFSSHLHNCFSLYWQSYHLPHAKTKPAPILLASLPPTLIIPFSAVFTVVPIMSWFIQGFVMFVLPSIM